VCQELGLLLSMVRLNMDEQQQAAAEALQQAGAQLLPAFGADDGSAAQQQEVRHMLKMEKGLPWKVRMVLSF
jgi:hypothetical protein